MTSAFVLVGIFRDTVPANGSSGDVERTTYPDGAIIEYDHAAHALKATLPGGGPADITVPDSVRVHCKTADATASENAKVHSQLTDTVGMAGSGADLAARPRRSTATWCSSTATAWRRTAAHRRWQHQPPAPPDVRRPQG
ncbi:hypothetical protein [Variovorax sp. V116]|uniref:hypothetical protein n=1 Tax=Variovorax sp. V116 TaxID=3065953 RepID=UPI0034E8DA0D